MTLRVCCEDQPSLKRDPAKARDYVKNAQFCVWYEGKHASKWHIMLIGSSCITKLYRHLSSQVYEAIVFISSTWSRCICRKFLGSSASESRDATSHNLWYMTRQIPWGPWPWGVHDSLTPKVYEFITDSIRHKIKSLPNEPFYFSL